MADEVRVPYIAKDLVFTLSDKKDQLEIDCGPGSHIAIAGQETCGGGTPKPLIKVQLTGVDANENAIEALRDALQDALAKLPPR